MTLPSQSWRDRAACLGVGTEKFFPLSGGQAYAVVKEAKRICSTCPVRQDCLETALFYEAEAMVKLAPSFGKGMRHGVWGGMTRNERHEYAKKRRNKVSTS